ncbi:BZ3500_MvSof-1268-A1-R1_Chr4-2g07188 [Microbotryum saponariae]|uniref:BZ3500_MvSof-1268-A1-R1_Chr4-2g07188 protein n=1 Tax=Microbotryum saponariae TaxID=289078 RepID=A0A2X0KTD5_9BASI|nr:BZ3500_MvSof-1268-A1-R1_Chr4-2g07188 [Microbotryum saponariae]SDA06853.1 BZ3501_MvSof-1269-A2-R1_Chr4-2g06899 [Microbotryum saponariae]
MSFEDSRAASRLRQRAVPYPTMAVRERAFKSGRALTGRADASSSALRDGAPAAAPPPIVKLDRSPGTCLGFTSTSNLRLPMLRSSHSGDIVVYLPEADGNEMAPMASSTNCTPEERLCAAFAKADRFPAHPDVVRRFLTRIALSGNGVGAYSVSHFRRFRTALEFWHTTHGLRMNYDPKMWTMQLAAAAATAPGPKPERLAATLDDLRCLAAGIDKCSPFDTTVFAAACAAFFAMARLGEFTAGSADEEFIAERHLAVANARRIDATTEAPLRYELDLPFDKVRRRVGRTLVVSARDGEPFCPVGGIDNHFRLNEPPPGRLFSYRAREGGHRQLTSSAFSRRIRDILEASGRAPLNNHSFRSGGATFYLREGVHTDHIRNLGRWSSNAFDRYWRRHKEIAIQVLSKAGKLAFDSINHLPHPNTTKQTERYTRKVVIPFPRSRTPLASDRDIGGEKRAGLPALRTQADRQVS